MDDFNYIIFSYIFTLVDNALNSYVVDTSTKVVELMLPLFNSMIMLWVVIWGYMLLFGKIEEPIKTGIFRIIRILLIFTFVFNITVYNDVIVNFFQGGAEQIASTMAGSTGSVVDMLNGIWGQILDSSLLALENASWRSPGMYIVALMIFIGGLVLFLPVIFFILMGKILLTVLLSLGALFIPLILFEPTKRFFEMWLGYVVNACLIIILASGMGTLILGIVDDVVRLMSERTGGLGVVLVVTDSYVLLLIMTLSGFVMTQVGGIASALGGGVSLGLGGAAKLAMAAVSPMSYVKGAALLGKNVSAVGKAAASPVTATMAAHRAYKKWKGNSIDGD